MSNEQVLVHTDPAEEGLHHAVGLLVFWLSSITADGHLDYFHDVVAELELKQVHIECHPVVFGLCIYTDH